MTSRPSVQFLAMPPFLNFAILMCFEYMKSYNLFDYDNLINMVTNIQKNYFLDY